MAKQPNPKPKKPKRESTGDPIKDFENQLRDLNSAAYRQPHEPKPKRPKKVYKNPAWAKRKRIVGGRCPREIREATLDRVRHNTLIHKQRRCILEDCNNIAVRESDYCRFHGDGPIWIMRRLMSDPDWRPDKISEMRRTFRKAMASGTLPPEMVENPVVRAVLEAGVLWTGPGWDSKAAREDPQKHHEQALFYARRNQARRLLNELANAWLALKDGDFGPWIAAVRKAEEAGFGT